MLAGLYYLGHRMNTGKTLFAQAMEHVPWKTFGRIIERHNGDSGVISHFYTPLGLLPP